MPDEYISHILGKISEEEYNALDKPFEEMIKSFGREREKPAILFIERHFRGKTVRGEQIYNKLIDFGFKRDIAVAVTALFSANKMVNEVLAYRKRNIEFLAYKATYMKRLHYTGAKSLTIYTSYARNDEIFIRPIKVPVPEIEKIKKSTQFIYIDGLEQVGYVYFALNHKDTLPYESTEYDHSMDNVRSFINQWVQQFFAKKNAFNLVEAEGITVDTRYGEEVPDHRVYEFELIDQQTEELRYGLRYEQGKFTVQKGNLPFFGIALELEKAGVWE